MKINRKGITALLFAAVISLGLGACGTGNEDVVVDNGANPAPSANVFVKTGTISTDSWGYTGSSPIQVAVPSQTEIVIEGHTLFLDGSQAVVSGTTNTRISFSSDKTTLTSAAQASAPANFVSYVNISMGSIKSAIPAISVTVDVGVALSGTTLTVYNYDTGTSRWISAQTALVSSAGKIIFPVYQLSLWGIFR
jgi:hypothetical protein